MTRISKLICYILKIPPIYLIMKCKYIWQPCESLSFTIHEDCCPVNTSLRVAVLRAEQFPLMGETLWHDAGFRNIRETI